MKCQVLFSGINKIINTLLSAELAQRMVKNGKGGKSFLVKDVPLGV